MRTNEIIASERLAVSTQVMQEFYVNAVRKSDYLMTSDKAMEWIEFLTEFPVQPITLDVVKTAMAFSIRYRISYWDGAILAAAQALAAPVLYTEDLNHGQIYGSVRAINPFIENVPLGLHEPAQRDLK